MTWIALHLNYFLYNNCPQILFDMASDVQRCQLYPKSFSRKRC